MNLFSYTQCLYTPCVYVHGDCVRTQNVVRIKYSFTQIFIPSLFDQLAYDASKIQFGYTIFILSIQPNKRDCNMYEKFPLFLVSYTEHTQNSHIPVYVKTEIIRKQECIAHGNPHTISRICTKQNKIEKKKRISNVFWENIAYLSRWFSEIIFK